MCQIKIQDKLAEKKEFWFELSNIWRCCWYEQSTKQFTVLEMQLFISKYFYLITFSVYHTLMTVTPCI